MLSIPHEIAFKFSKITPHSLFDVFRYTLPSGLQIPPKLLLRPSATIFQKVFINKYFRKNFAKISKFILTLPVGIV